MEEDKSSIVRKSIGKSIQTYRFSFPWAFTNEIPLSKKR
jgi:hypothetical protein